MVLTFLRNANLRNKLMLLLILFILAPLSLAGFLFYQSSADLVRDKTDKETLQVLNLVKQNADQMLQGLEAYLMDIYDQEDIIERLREVNGQGADGSQYAEDVINRYLRDFLRGKDDIDSIYLITPGNNTFFADFRGSTLFTDKIREHPEWLDHISSASGRVVWIPTYEIPPSRYSSNPSRFFAVGMQIKDVSDELQTIGALIINMKISALDRLIGPVNVSPQGSILVADDAGHVLWHRNEEAYRVNLNAVPFYKEAKPRRFAEQRLNGTSFRIGRVTSTYNNWSYFALVPQSDLVAQTRNQKRFLLVTIAAFSFLFVLLAWLTTHYITKPVRQMVVAMKQIQRDNLGVRLQAQSNDEIGLLQTTFNSMRGRINDLIHEVRVISEKEKEAEIRALQAQINPHFVYNTLDAINWLAIERQELDISSMITALSDMMRYAIRPGEQWVTVEEELKWALNYAYLQKMRFEGRFAIKFRVEEELLSCFVPRMLLQPYLENSIIHGMEDREKDGLICVTLTQDELCDRIRLVVEDNGSGITADKLQRIKERKNHGIGIYNLDDRLKLEHGENFGVTVESEPGKGTKVTIILPKLFGAGQRT